MYYGEAYTSVDDKGRVNIPKEFRTQMESNKHDTWIVTRGFDGALFLFEKAEWEKVLESVRTRSALDPKMLDFRRFLLGGASELKADAQGRFSVSLPLREYAEIERDAVMIGVEDHIELWSRRVWKEFQQKQRDHYKIMASQVLDHSVVAACGAA